MNLTGFEVVTLIAGLVLMVLMFRLPSGPAPSITNEYNQELELVMREYEALAELAKHKRRQRLVLANKTDADHPYQSLEDYLKHGDL